MKLDADLMSRITPEVIQEALNIVEGKHPKKTKLYPVNSRGIPEYQSVLYTVDHLFWKRNTEGLAVQKMVFSTEQAHEAMLSLMEYYGDRLTKAHLETIMAWRNNSLSDVLVYFPPEGERDKEGLPFCQIVVSVALFDRICRDPAKGAFSHLMVRETIYDELERAFNQAAAMKVKTAPLISVAIYNDDDLPSAGDPPTQEGPQE